MRILFLIPSFKGGGAERQCVYLLNEIQSLPGIEVHLVYFIEGVNFELLSIDNLTLHKVKYRSFYNPINIWRLFWVFKKVKPDLWISWLHAADVYSFFLKLFFREAKWIMTERDSYYPKDWKYMLRNKVGLYADQILANSKKGVNYWTSKGFQIERINRVNNILYKPNLPRLRKKDYVLYVGRFEKQKNVELLADAFACLAHDHPNLTFYMIGEGDLNTRLEEIAKDKSNLILLPYQRDLRDFYLRTKVFVNISNHEGTPNTVIENLSFGNLIVASKIDEHVEILGMDYPYYVEKRNDLAEIIAVISDAVKSSHDFSSYSQIGKSIAEMNPDSVLKHYIGIFYEILK